MPYYIESGGPLSNLPKPKTEYQTVSELLDIIDDLDIVEFNRVTYSHFALYISDGLCVHVLAPGTKSAEYLTDIAKGDLVRVNNGVYTAKLLGVKPRSRSDCLSKAFSGLPTDNNGKVIVGAKITVRYNVVSDDNCEGYATFWKYEHESGWSAQAVAGVGYLCNTTRRVCEVSMHGYKKLLDKAPPVLKPAVVLAAAPVEVIRVAGQATSATANFVTGCVRTIFK